MFLFSSALSWPLLNQNCMDPRIPYISGSEILFCDNEGRSTQIFNPQSGQVEQFDVSVLWFSSEYVWSAGIEGGLKPRKSESDDINFRHRLFFEPQGGPVFFKDEALVVQGSDVVWNKKNVGHRNSQAHAKSWEHPVLNECGAFWIDKQERIVWWKRDGSVEMSSFKNHPRSLVGDTHWVGWAEDEYVWLWDCESGQNYSWNSRAIDRVTLNNGILCWSFWTGFDADIQCSNDVVLKLEGDQLWPSLGNGWLIFRDHQGIRGVELEQ